MAARGRHNQRAAADKPTQKYEQQPIHGRLHSHNARSAKLGHALDQSLTAPGDRILRFRGWSLVTAVIKTKSSLTSNAVAGKAAMLAD
jgi:hypothetical protein